MLSSQKLSNITRPGEVLREFDRERRHEVNVRKNENDFALLERRQNDRSKWIDRAEKNNLLKQNTDKLTPSVDEWLAKSVAKKKLAKR
jgi:hypothetical protein